MRNCKPILLVEDDQVDASSFLDKKHTPVNNNIMPAICITVTRSPRMQKPSNAEKKGVVRSRAETWAALIRFKPS